MRDELPGNIPSHLTYHLTQQQWDFIVQKSEEWDAHIVKRNLMRWMIPNWMITYAMNPDPVNRTWIIDRLKQEGFIANPLDLIEFTETLRRD